MRMIRGNVEREVEGAQAEKLLARGFKTLCIPSEEKPTRDAGMKNLCDMKVSELKELAKEKGVEGVASLNKEEILVVLKDVI